MNSQKWIVRLVAMSALIVAALTACGANASIAEDPVEEEPSGEATANECLGTGAMSDLWPGLEGSVPDFAESIRTLTGGLADMNSFSCQPMVVVDPAVDAGDLGAGGVVSLEHAEPAFRVDLVAFESAAAADAAGGSDAVAAALAATLSDDANWQVDRPRPYLVMVTSWADPDGTGAMPRDGILAAPPSLQFTFQVADYYTQQVFGSE